MNNLPPLPERYTWDQHNNGVSFDLYTEQQMRAYAAAAVAGAVPPGWKVVPVEPTGGMTGAMQDAALANYDATINHELADGPEPEGWCRAVYRAMLAAAPEVLR